MKKRVIIITSIMLSLLLFNSCSSTIKTTSGTSLVTITIGNDKVASLDIRQATLWAKLKLLLADVSVVPAAHAYIPTLVQSLLVTVTAPDIPAITKTADVSGQISATITIEVPNGAARRFTIEGIDSSGAVTFRGTASADITGAPVTLPITMSYAGAGIYVNAATGSDITGDGTKANPYKTITYALTLNPLGNETIVVEQGTYNDLSEFFPLQLNPGTKLICLGPNHTTVLSTTNDGIYGNTGASVENCVILVCDSSGIEDSTSPMIINHVLIDEESSGCGPLDGIVLSADSTVIDSSIKYPSGAGVEIDSGNPIINDNTIIGNSSSFYGIYVAMGSATIDSNILTGFTPGGYGVFVGNGTPAITHNSIAGNSYGIYIWDGAPTIMQNSIYNNSDTGIYVSLNTANPVINYNGIYCNSIHDLWSSASSSIDARFNSWDHAPPNVYSNSLEECTYLGDDICWSGGLPLFDGYGSAVSGGCP